MEKSTFKKALGSAWLVMGLCGLCCAPALIAGFAALFATGAMLTGEALGFIVAACLLLGITLYLLIRNRNRWNQGPSCDIGSR